MKQDRSQELFPAVKKKETIDLKLPNSANVVTNTLELDKNSGKEIVVSKTTPEQKLEEPYLLVFLPGPSNGKFDPPKDWANVDTAAGCTGEAKALFASKILKDNKIKVYFVVPFTSELIAKTELPGDFISDAKLEFTAKFKNFGIEIFEHLGARYPRRAALFVGANKHIKEFILSKESTLCGEASKQAALQMVTTIENYVQQYMLQNSNNASSSPVKSETEGAVCKM